MAIGIQWILQWFRKFKFYLTSVELTKKNISTFDLVILSTDHDAFDYNLIKKEAKLVVDTRGVYEQADKIFHA